MSRILFQAFSLVMLTIVSTTCLYAGSLPDTGQTKCYDNLVEITCPSPGQDYYGQDAQYQGTERSFTKLDANGNDLADSATSWVMVRDNVTGLIWEVKTDDGTKHDKDQGYKWIDADSIFINGVNGDNFCGYSDWRLPTVKELSSLVDASKKWPCIDTTYFPNTAKDFYHASYWSVLHAHYTSEMWHVDFLIGLVNLKELNGKYTVRAVRREQAEVLDNLIVNGDGTVTDPNTGLMWEQVDGGQMNWQSALYYSENLSLGGYTDWRLPNRNELQSIVDYDRYIPAIDTTIFSTCQSYEYWSSTTIFNATDHAWCVDFNNGSFDSDGCGKATYRYVRAVRGGQAEPTYWMPTVSTGSATSITANSAKLSGTVNPNGASSSCYFEYGTTTSFGTATASGDAGSGTSDQSVSGSISALEPDTTYYFRIVAVSSHGTSYGDEQSFTTQSASGGTNTGGDIGGGGGGGGGCFINTTTDYSRIAK